MVDYFAILGVPRQAGLSLDAARAAFQVRGAGLHPDAGDAADRSARAAQFVELNEAFSVLSSRPRRLRHLLELMGGAPTRGAVLDDGLMALFSQINAAVQLADACLAQQAAATSALAKALLTSPALAAEAALAAAAQTLLARSEALDARLAAKPDAATLASAVQEAAFLEKWDTQVQSRRLRLLD